MSTEHYPQELGSPKRLTCSCGNELPCSLVPVPCSAWVWDYKLGNSAAAGHVCENLGCYKPAIHIADDGQRLVFACDECARLILNASKPNSPLNKPSSGGGFV